MKSTLIRTATLCLLTFATSTRLLAQAALPASSYPAYSDLLSAQTPQTQNMLPSPYYSYSGANRTKESGAAALVFFSAAPDQKAMDALEEDLNVMSLLIERQLDRLLGKNAPNYKMGIPMLLKTGQRGVQCLYLENFGALFTLNVNFPLIAPPAKPATDEPVNNSDWDAARKELYGHRAGSGSLAWETRQSESPEFDAEQVDALKKTLFDTLKNAANIRSLKSDEFIGVTVSGTESLVPTRSVSDANAPGGVAERDTEPTRAPGAEQKLLEELQTQAQLPKTRSFNQRSPGGGGTFLAGTGRGTALTLRVNKADAEAFAKGTLTFEQFRGKATLQTYTGPAGRTPASAASYRWRESLPAVR
jgi:hypothetical protein